MNSTRMVNFTKGLVIIGVALVWLFSFDWFRTLIHNLLIGGICLIGIFLVYHGIKIYRRYKER